jgi:hypothetical protein
MNVASRGLTIATEVQLRGGNLAAPRSQSLKGVTPALVLNIVEMSDGLRHDDIILTHQTHKAGDYLTILSLVGRY